MLPKKCLHITGNKLQHFLCYFMLFYLSTIEISSLLGTKLVYYIEDGF